MPHSIRAAHKTEIVGWLRDFLAPTRRGISTVHRPRRSAPVYGEMFIEDELLCEEEEEAACEEDTLLLEPDEEEEKDTWPFS